MNDQKDTANWITAVLLCLGFWFAWDYFLVAPERKAAAERAKAEHTATSPAAPGTPASGAPALVGKPREVVIQQTGTRIPFDNGKVDGTIRLTGGAIDDLSLQAYRETLDPKSPEIVFLAPEGSVGATFTEMGWTGAPGSATPVPGPKTLWNAAGAKLTADAPLVLTWDNGQGLKFTRTIALDRDYMFTITDKVENASPNPVTLYPYAIVTRDGEPKHQQNWLVHEGLTGVLQGLWEKDTTYADARKFENGEVKKESTGGWLGVTDKYWHAAIIPPQNEKFTGRFSYAKQGEQEIFRADYLLGARNVAAGGSATVTHHLYAGAKVVSLIEKYQRDLGIQRFDMTIDWGWFSFFTYWMFKAIDWLYQAVGNFGAAIILFTIVIKILLFPLQQKAYESASKMKKVQPEMKVIQERYKDDPMKARQEQAALFQREGVNPLMGCLPVLLSMPILFSLYKVLTITIEMRHAPFIGWIHDLSAADPTSLFNLFGLLPFALPTWLHIGVWPLLMGITMWFQMNMSPQQGGDPAQQQVMQFMPIMFTYMMGQVAAGLVIYWTFSNFLGIIQQYVLMRRMKVPIDIIDNFKWPPWLGGKSSSG